MKKAITFKTHSSHTYLFSPNRNYCGLCHPLIDYFHRLDESGSLKSYIAKVQGQSTLKIRGSGSFTSSEFRYQYKKYRFLKRHRFFIDPGSVKLGGRLAPEKIRQNLGSIKQVIFESTEACNLSCTYCTYSKFYINKERGNKKFDPESAFRFLDLVLKERKEGEKHLIVSFYGGEPLKNMSFIRNVVSFLLDGYADTWTFKFTMSTNGLLLLKYSDYLVQHHFDISVSLDGNEYENSFRVLHNTKPSYHIVVKNLDALRKRYPEFFETNISFLTVLHKRNDYNHVNLFFKKRYGKKPLVSLINTLNVAEQYKNEFRDIFLSDSSLQVQDYELMHALFLSHPTVKELANVLEHYGGFVFNNHLKLLSSENGRIGSKMHIPTATCLPFSLRVYLTADGSILPCEHISREFEIGKFLNQEPEINFESIAQLFNKGYERIESLCDKCFLSDHCRECLFNTYIKDGRLVCEYFQDENQFKKYLIKNFSIMEMDKKIYKEVISRGYNEE